MSILPIALLLLAASQTPPAITSGWAGPAASGIYYEIAGQGPAVILIHGGQMDRRMWDLQFLTLAAGRLVLRYDVRGFGKSPAPTAPYSDVEDLRAVMDAAGISKASLVGLSLGGRISIDFAVSYPDRVESLALSGPGLSGWEWSDESRERSRELRAAVEARDKKKIVEAWLRNDYMRPAMEHADLAPTLRRLAEENGAAWLMDDALNRDGNLRAVDHLAGIKAPIMLMIGDRDVPDIRRITTAILSLAPTARRLLFRGAGHILNMERPGEFNGALLVFLPEGKESPAATSSK